MHAISYFSGSYFTGQSQSLLHSLRCLKNDIKLDAQAVQMGDGVSVGTESVHTGMNRADDVMTDASAEHRNVVFLEIA